MKEKKIKYSTVTVTYNSEHVILEAFADLLNRDDVEILIVDNNSSDATVKKIESLNAINITLIKSEANLGYGKASNLALEKATGEFIVLLNPDASIKYNILESLTNAAILHNIDITTPKLSSNLDDANKIVNFEYKELDWCIFGLVLIKREVFEKIGNFDENIFMYFEDLDLCRRAKNNNMHVAEFFNIFAYHKGGASSVPSCKITYIKETNMEKSRMYFKLKHFPLKYNFYTLHLQYIIRYLLKLILAMFKLNINDIAKFYCRLVGVLMSIVKTN